MQLRQELKNSCRSSGPSDSLAPPPSPYPTQVDPSPVDSNGTEIEEDAQEDSRAKSPNAATNGEIQSPDIEITSPQRAAYDSSRFCETHIVMTLLGSHIED